MANEKKYYMPDTWWSSLAETIRDMSGTSSKMRPADIITWLNRVKYIPQGMATTYMTLDGSWTETTTAINPVYQSEHYVDSLNIGGSWTFTITTTE